MTQMILSGVQLDIAWEDREANHAKVRAMLAANSPAPGSLIALPEMFASGFSMNVDRIAEDEAALTARFLSETAKRYGIFVVGGLVTRSAGGKGRNEAVVADAAGKIVTRYCKIQPYTPGGEANHYEAGALIEMFSWSEARVAPLICYDLRFPELFRNAMGKGANVLVVIASWPSPRVEHWIALLRARAIENQSYVLGVNRCGSDPHLPYPGRSLIVDFKGDVLADAGSGEGMISAPVDLMALAAYRKQFPFLADAKSIM